MILGYDRPIALCATGEKASYSADQPDGCRQDDQGVPVYEELDARPANTAAESLVHQLPEARIQPVPEPVSGEVQ